MTPIYPNSFDIEASGNLPRSSEVLRDAWQKKAEQVAAGRKFRASPLTVRIAEVSPGTWPIRSRVVSGSITIVEQMAQ